MTPESSLDSGHETNSSEMTDISEMVSAFKQHHLLAYQGNKTGLIMKKDVPFSAVRCCAHAAFRGVPCTKRHCEETNTLSAVASSKQSPLSGSIPLKPGHVTGYCTVHMRPRVFTHYNESTNRLDNVILTPVLQHGCLSCPKIAEENMLKKPIAQSQEDSSKKLTSPEEVTNQSEDKSFLHVGEDRTCIKQLPNGRNSGNSPRFSRHETRQENSLSYGSTSNTHFPVSMYTDSCAECDSSKNEHLKFEGNMQGSSGPCECHLLKSEVPAQRQVDSQGHRTAFHTCTPKDNEVAYVKVNNRKYQPATGKEISALFNNDLIDLVVAPTSQKNDPIKTEKASQPRRTSSPNEECYLSPYRYPIATLGLDNNTAQQVSTEKMKHQVHTCSFKTNISSEKTDGIPTCSKPSSLSGVSLTHVTSSPENVFDAQQHTSLIPDKAKSQKGSLLNFKNLFSATFPARFKKESDERQEQLQKVKQYELEFLEELLKPKTKVDVFAEDYLYRIASGRCPCQIKSSPVGNIPGLSREQRRSCDCKRRGLACNSMCFPSILSTMESQRAERANGPCVHKQPKTSVVPSALDINTKQKAVRRRTSSLESSDYRSEQQPGVFCMMARGECLKLPPGRKLQRHHSATNIISEAEISELMSECSENSTNMAVSNAEEPRNLEKGSEFIRKVLKNQCQEPTQCDYQSHVNISNIDKKQRSPAIFSIQGDAKPSRSVPLLKEDMAGNDRCCSFRYCFYYRNCDVADDSSDKDELSYSVPMQLLPDLKSDSSVTLSETLVKPYQMSDKTVLNGSGDKVQQEAVLSDADGNITQINALRNRAYMLPDGFIVAQQDTSELLTILRQSTANRGNYGPKLLSHLDEYKQTLTQKFKELRTACRRVAAVDKSPTRMLTAISTSFQVLCGLIETFVHLVYIMRSERQCRELLSKVEEVVINYTFLLRAAEESSSGFNKSMISSCVGADGSALRGEEFTCVIDASGIAGIEGDVYWCVPEHGAKRYLAYTNYQ